MKYLNVVFLALCLIFVGSYAFGAMSDEDFVDLCESGSAEKIEEALEQGAFVGAQGRWSPLLRAAYANPNPRVIELLVEFGADVDEVASDYLRVYNYGSNDDNYETMYNCMPTPLMLAAYCNTNPEVVRTLIQAGVNVNAMTGYRGHPRRSPLYWALRRPPFDRI